MSATAVPETLPREQWPSSQQSPKKQPKRGLFDKDVAGPALQESVRKLDPRLMARNLVMFIVEIGAAITTVILVQNLLGRGDDKTWFVAAISLWLWFTVLFANFAEALAEGRGKAQAATLRKTRSETMAKVMVGGDRTNISLRSSGELQLGDLVLVETGDTIPGDGEVIEGIAYVSEAAITGESAPVLKEPGTDISSSVTGGTQVVSDELIVRITTEPGKSFLDRMIALVEGAVRQKTPNEIALNILLAGLTIIFLIVVVTLAPISRYAGAPVSITILIALLVTLIPTTIGALLSAIGIAGMDRLVQRNVLAMSGRAVEAAGDVDVLLLDKTGTITFGNRMAAELFPITGVSQQEIADAALRSSLADETPEGKSIVELARALGATEDLDEMRLAEFIPFSAETRMSGVRIGHRTTMKGAVDAIQQSTGLLPVEIETAANRIAEAGGTPLAIVDNGRSLGVIYLKDTVKPGMRERFAELRAMGIKTVMVTGDNKLTAATIATEAGVDDFVAEAKPEQKIQLIRDYQTQGRLVAMTGDGTNDAPALAQADVGVAMNTGTAAAKEAGNMVDLDSDPTKLIDIVAIGKQLLMTRGALTTFSISNDVAKYFAIIPAIFIAAYPSSGKNDLLGSLNVMRLESPESAILSAIIFNALIIVALIPLALRGIPYKPMAAGALLRRNLLIYGAGGLIAPFIGIKLIDLLLSAIGLT
ncbi:MAG TPA: potassium-transporting ATPase subunit KdpB [Thermomicrobiales bacterium]|nr:potassium-transporting ATPase subunit KdpB [Thermomicrobiales bacterium]